MSEKKKEEDYVLTENMVQKMNGSIPVIEDKKPNGQGSPRTAIN